MALHHCGLQMKILDKKLAAEAIKLDPTNARRHSERQIEMIANSIRRFGFVTRLICRPDGQVIGGEATFIAGKRAGLTEFPVTIVEGLTDPQYKMLALALNKLPENSSWDAERLAETVRELSGVGEDVRLIGFSDKELQALVIEPEQLDIYEVSKDPVADEFWISIRGPLAEQADVLLALDKAIGKIPNVSLELGTIVLQQGQQL